MSFQRIVPAVIAGLLLPVVVYGIIGPEYVMIPILSITSGLAMLLSTMGEEQ